MKTSRSLPLLITLLLIVLLGCSNSYVKEIERGDGYNYRPGFPELRIASTGYIGSNNESFITVSGEIVEGSLIYLKKEKDFESSIQVDIRIIEDSEVNQTVHKADFIKQLSSESKTIVNSQDVFKFERDFKVDPGSYTIQIAVVDQVSGKRTLRETNTYIPNPADVSSHITDISLLGKNSTRSDAPDFNLATTYDLSAKLDSIKIRFQVTNNDPDSSISLDYQLLRFRSDTSIARPMNFNDYSTSSLPYSGIEYREFEVVQSSSRTLEQPGNVVIEYNFSNLPRGNYRLEVFANKGKEDEIYKAREFGIKSLNYPSLKTPEELAKPLYYLMERKEYEKLMEIDDPNKMKMAIDRFWLSNIQNSTIAKNVIALYYQRVEEANKQFTNFKEGWKTDPGMIYILFGPPLYSDIFSDQMVWSYSYNRDDPEKNFLFERTRLKNDYFPFHHYVLKRSSYYYSIQLEQIERWLSGRILKRSI